MTGTRDGLDSDGALARGPDSTLSAALADLDDGCSVLVTGDVSDEAYRVAASRYFGATQRRRQRVLALTNDGAGSPSAWFPDDVTDADDDAAVVRLDGTLRDPAATTRPNADGEGKTAHSPASSTDGPDNLDLDGRAAGPADGTDGGGDNQSDAGEIRTAMVDAIDQVEADANADRSSRLGLRVGVYRVDMLCATLGSEAAGELLREVSQTTIERGGMAHLHLPRPTGETPRSDPVVDEFVDLLGDALDVIVELRTRESASVPEERWHIFDWGTTEWNALR